MEPLISVIVPIYNVKAYLDRCVESLLGQSYKDLEIFLVDDGSTDGCGKYVTGMPRRTHESQCSTRRTAACPTPGMRRWMRPKGNTMPLWTATTGCRPTTWKTSIGRSEKPDADIAVSCFEEVFEGRGIQSQPAAELENFQSLTSEACLRRMLYQDGVETSTPTKLYKKELFEGLRYPVGKLTRISRSRTKC